MWCWVDGVCCFMGISWCWFFDYGDGVNFGELKSFGKGWMDCGWFGFGWS